MSASVAAAIPTHTVPQIVLVDVPEQVARRKDCVGVAVSVMRRRSGDGAVCDTYNLQNVATIVITSALINELLSYLAAAVQAGDDA